MKRLHTHAYHPEALAELGAAQDWYEAEMPGLGLELQDAIEEAIDRIKATPEAAPAWPDIDAPVTVRRALIRRFPFALAYFVHAGTVSIIAVAHTSRKPGYWRHRLAHQ